MKALLLVLALCGCASWSPGWEAKCGPRADPALMPCSCMNPATPSCPTPPNDDHNPISDAKKPGESK